MFENETIRLMELRMLARPDRHLLARIDRLLQNLARFSASGGTADPDDPRHEVEAIAQEIARRRAERG